MTSYNNFSLSWRTGGSEEHQVNINRASKDATDKNKEVQIDGHSYSLEGTSKDISLVLSTLRQRTFSTPQEFQDALNQLPFLGDRKVSVKPSSLAVALFRDVHGISGSSKPAGSIKDIERQDEEAGRKFLATYRALYLGGKPTAESRLVLSAFLPGKIILSPPSLHIERSLLVEINQVLSREFDMTRTPIHSITLVSEPGRRNRVLRIELKNTSKSVVFKESHPTNEKGQTPTAEEMKDTYDRFSRDWAGLEFASGLKREGQLTPQSYGGSVKHRFILQEDLGKDQMTLAGHLLQGDTSAVEGSLGRYMSCLGRFHAAGHANIDKYLEILHRINPEAPQISIEGMTEESLKEVQSVLTLLGLPHPDGLEGEVKDVVMTIFNPKGPFATVTHGDPCPDNVFDYPDRLLLIDFEWASVESALIDATYPRMNMPTGWCAAQLPEELLDKVEVDYREEMKKLIPEAGDDKIYFKAFACACVMHLLKSDMRRIRRVIDNDERWGIAQVRDRVLSHIKTFIIVSEKHKVLPALNTMATEILRSLESKWKDSKPLELYPAFTDFTYDWIEERETWVKKLKENK